MSCTAYHTAFVFLPLHMATLTLNHGTKKSSSNSTRKEKIKVVRTTIESKKKIITKLENGVRVSDLAVQYSMAKSMISTSLKNREAIKSAVVKGVMIVHSKQRPQIMDDVENLL